MQLKEVTRMQAQHVLCKMARNIIALQLHVLSHEILIWPQQIVLDNSLHGTPKHVVWNGPTALIGVSSLNGCIECSECLLQHGLHTRNVIDWFNLIQGKVEQQHD